MELEGDDAGFGDRGVGLGDIGGDDAVDGVAELVAVGGDDELGPLAEFVGGGDGGGGRGAG